MIVLSAWAVAMAMANIDKTIMKAIVQSLSISISLSLSMYCLRAEEKDFIDEFLVQDNKKNKNKK